MKKLFLIFLISTFSIFAQERVLISPDNDVIPLTKNQSSSELAKAMASKNINLVDCDNHGTFGYPTWLYNMQTNGLIMRHQEVYAMRFEAPEYGIIDSVFLVFTPSPYYDTADFLITPRMFKSNIHPNQVHGVYTPDYLKWGYYLNTADLDGGIAPFLDEATNPNWISTNQDSTWDPFGDEMWGLGGIPIPVHIGQSTQIFSIAMDLWGSEPYVHQGESFFFCFRNETLHNNEIRATLGYTLLGERIKPWRLWKFYEHRLPPALSQGWVALNAGNLNIWYTMKLNYPPPKFIPTKDWLVSGTDAWTDIKLNILKFCKPEYLDSADIASVWVDYRFNYGNWDSVQAHIVGDTMLSATIPGKPAGTFVELRGRTVDFNGSTITSIPLTFRVTGIIQNGFIADTSASFDWVNIDSMHNGIPYHQFFLRTNAVTPKQNIDDGTAGPFDLGFTFDFFGDSLRYGWIGVNGGLALTASATDTQHLNSSDYFNLWDIPQTQEQPFGIPKNFIAPLWSDLRLYTWYNCDSGKIFWRRDVDRFIIQWKGLTPVANDTDCASNFEVILDKQDTSITFLYDSVGWSGIEKSALAGFQADTTKWFYVCRAGEPENFVPKSKRALKFKKLIVGVNDKESTKPLSYLLHQNYPNPFNPVTVIRYELPVSSGVKLKVYNILGVEVATLVDEFQSPGFKSVSWNPEGIANGVYLYKLTAGASTGTAFMDVKKMILVK
ncbi:MAG: T9SS type A sorting domain-containing protein [Bacteroidota bacterium]|nr:T9SS type A sorting domain-containing protein [Bacteroidota bacterium]